MIRFLAMRTSMPRSCVAFCGVFPHSDIRRVQDVGLSGADDAQILSWAARENCVVLTHDLRTMPSHAYGRIVEGESIAGVFAVSSAAPLRQIMDDLVLLTEQSEENEWRNHVLYLPLR